MEEIKKTNRKKNNKTLLIILVILLLLASGIIIFFCTRDNDTYSLKGTLKGGENNILVLMEMEGDGVKAIDTIHLDSKGKFSATEQIKEPGLFILQGENDYVMICPSKKEKINIEGDFYDLSLSCSVTGSKESQNLRLLIDRQKKTGLILKAIQNEWDMAAPEQKDSLWVVNKEKFRQLHKAEKDFLKNYIAEHSGSLTTIPALYTTVMNNPIFSPDQDFAVYQKVLKGLEKTLPSNKHTINLREFIKKVELSQQAIPASITDNATKN